MSLVFDNDISAWTIKLTKNNAPTNKFCWTIICFKQDKVSVYYTYFLGVILGKHPPSLLNTLWQQGGFRLGKSSQKSRHKRVTTSSMAGRSSAKKWWWIPWYTKQGYNMHVPPQGTSPHPTLGKGESSWKVPFWGNMLVPRRVTPVTH